MEALTSDLGHSPKYRHMSEFDDLLEQLRAAHMREVEILRAREPMRDSLQQEQNVAECGSRHQVTINSAAVTIHGIEALDPTFSEGFRSLSKRESRDPQHESDGAATKASSHSISGSKQIQTFTSWKVGPLEQTRPVRFSDALKELQDCASDDKKLSDSASRLEKLVCSTEFDAFFSGLILLNCVQFAFHLQLQGMDSGAKKGLSGVVARLDEHSGFEAASEALEIFGHILSASFVLEGCLRLAALGPRRFALSWWNWFDSIISLGWIVDLLAVGELPLHPGALRSLRVVRLLRALKVLRQVQYCDSLFLLTVALKGGVGVLFWALVYLTMLQMTLAVIATAAIHSFYLEDASVSGSSVSDCSDSTESQQVQVVFDYFGTTTRAFLTMFEMTLANWPPVCRVMADALGEWWIILAVCHKLVMGLGLVGIFNAAVMQEIFKAAGQDANVIVRDRMRARERTLRTLNELFRCNHGRHATDEDATLTEKEFEEVCKNPVFKLWMSSIGINARDAENIFQLADDGDGHLSAEEFLDCVERVQGISSGIDLRRIVTMAEELKAIRAEAPQGKLSEQQHQELATELQLLQTDVATLDRNSKGDTPGFSGVVVEEI
eukprot:CAMPEP_0178402476 /NCGR_PEP_ID=MMETSP0689_2-20121128/16863_1 /TAXON_ID=160604 /ORGANISM="Amphidinium massartii, Strain CS-259" /LENGTH=608 /DNA_ID=CAMNT_0020023381 /DNA_START=26 /DNA_END=1852 /DNA_ORIENTATION=-